LKGDHEPFPALFDPNGNVERTFGANGPAKHILDRPNGRVAVFMNGTDFACNSRAARHAIVGAVKKVFEATSTECYNGAETFTCHWDFDDARPITR
jgi:hypothetical protein